MELEIFRHDVQRMDKDNCLYSHYVYSYESSGILFELKVILATS